jgi:site-specific DNA recombinase
MTTRTAVLYARVSSREQREEGYSIEAQVNLLREAGAKDRLEIVHEFIEIESAKDAGRKQFAEMVTYFKRHRSCRSLLVEKTDRLYRNQRDALTLEDLDINIVFVKEGDTLSKESKSQVKFMHDIRLAMAKNYSENLREEVNKGMNEKAVQGGLPGRAPFGYRNLPATRTVEIHPEMAHIARYVFDTYATGKYSVQTLSKEVEARTGTFISKTNIHKMLNNPYYVGLVRFRGKTYQGVHEPLVSHELWSRCQTLLHVPNRAKYGRRAIAFRGMLHCVHDGCTVTGDIKKERYVYYTCSHGRGPCELPRFREEEIVQRLGALLKDLYVPPHVAARIVGALEQDAAQQSQIVNAERVRLERELKTLLHRMDKAYSDKLDGVIPDELWQRKQTEWRTDEIRIRAQLASPVKEQTADRIQDVRRIFELAESAHSLYLTRKPAEQADLLRMVLSNCSIDAVSLYPTYRKPFDLIVKRAKNHEWSGRRDSNPRPSAPKTDT